MEGLVIGIDLGTTFSLAAYAHEGGVELIKNENWTTFQPSVVTITPNGIKIGWEALEARETSVGSSFYSFKRFMGRGLEQLDEIVAHLPYKVSAGIRKNLLLGEPPHQFAPEDLSALVLKHIKNLAEKILGLPVEQAIITVPAYFDDAERQATKDAALIAGIKIMRIINEPTAAAIAYGLENKENAVILVFDLGGGTFDITILKIQDQVFRVLTTFGDTHLGGDDFDHAIAEHLAAQHPDAFNLQNPTHRQRLKTAAEKLKIELSTNLEAEVFSNTDQGQIKLKLQRSELDALLAPWLKKIHLALAEALKGAKKTVLDIDSVVLVGGSTRVPAVRTLVQQFFGKAPYLRLDPDKVVAYGAAIQADMLKNKRRDFLLMDVIPLSLGLETLGGVFSKLIMKNSSLPAKAKETFSTSVDNQTAVDINIYQGEREFIKDCRLLGKFRLKGLPKMPAGLPRIEVDFVVDTNGLLQVKALELRSGTQAVLEVVPEHGLTKQEVEQRIEESIAFAEADFSERGEVELVEKAHNLLQGLQRATPQLEKLLPVEEQKEIFKLKAQVEKFLDKKDYDQLKPALETLGEHTRELADRLISLAAKAALVQPNKA